MTKWYLYVARGAALHCGSRGQRWDLAHHGMSESAHRLAVEGWPLACEPVLFEIVGGFVMAWEE